MDATEIKAKPAPARTFRLVDMLMLVAATAVGFWLSGMLFGSPDNTFSWPSIRDIWIETCQFSRDGQGRAMMGEALFSLGWAVSLTGVASLPMVGVWTVAVLLIRLFGPRPPMRRVSRQPGFAALVVTTAAIAFTVVPFSLIIAWVGWDELTGAAYIFVALAIALPLAAGVSVVVAWTGLVTGRRWRAEASWIDRLGRVLGICWILASLNSSLIVLFDNPLSTPGFKARSFQTVTTPDEVADTANHGHPDRTFNVVEPAGLDVGPKP